MKPNINKYLTIGGIGHRDLPTEKISLYKQKIKDIFIFFNKDSDRELLILSSLADGADRLIVDAAIEDGISFAVVLPMPKLLYMQDFSVKSQEAFNQYIERALYVDVANLYVGNTYESINKEGINRNYQYWQSGNILAKSCDKMIALWDDKINYKLGGTADIVQLRQNYYKKPINIIACERTGNL